MLTLFHYTDMTLQEEDLSELKTLLSKRAARKGNVTRIKNEFILGPSTALRNIDQHELQTKLDTLLRHQELFENIQARVIAVATAVELVADSLTLEDQCNSINITIRLFQSDLGASGQKLSSEKIWRPSP